MLGARRGVHTGYVAPSERSGALLIGAERLAEGAGLLLIGQERLADLAAWLLIDDERLSERSAWLLIDDERPSECVAWLLIDAERLSERSAWLLIDAERPPESSEGLPLGTGCLRRSLGGLMVVAAWLVVTAAARVGCRRRIGCRVGSGIRRRVRRGRRRGRWCRSVAAAGLSAADVVELGAVLYGEQQHQQVAQRGARLQHAEGVQYVVGAADGGIGGLAGIGSVSGR